MSIHHKKNLPMNHPNVLHLIGHIFMKLNYWKHFLDRNWITENYVQDDIFYFYSGMRKNIDACM